MMSELRYLPTCAGIYFAIEEGGEVAYIGQSLNIRQRWRSHHVQDDLCDLTILESARRVRLAWLEVSDVDALSDLERTMIQRFMPRLNDSYARLPRTVMPPQENVRMLTTREVAEKIDANPGTVRMWCINGTFPNAEQQETPRGPIWLVPETDLQGFKRRSPGRPSKKATKENDQADQETAGDQVKAPADEPMTPKRKASKRSSAKKALKNAAKKAKGN